MKLGIPVRTWILAILSVMLLALAGCSSSASPASSADNSWTILNRPGDGSNSEVENYQTANVAIGGELLVLTEQHQTTTATGTYLGDPPPTSCTSLGNNLYSCTSQYSSGAVQWATFNQQYGDFQISAKFGYGWPAIWMLGSNCQTTFPNGPDNVSPCDWDEPGSGEIDIAEGEEVNTGATLVLQNVYEGSTSYHGTASGLSDITENYHVYEVIVTSSEIVWKVDGVQTNSTGAQVADKWFLIINNAIGGNLGGTPSSYSYPNSTSVNWVKVCSSACANGIAGAPASNGTFFDNFTSE